MWPSRSVGGILLAPRGGHPTRPPSIWPPGGRVMGVNWSDSRQIGELLFEKYDTLNPLTVRFTDLHKWVLDLEDSEGKPGESNEKALEAIQMAWYEEWKDEYGDG